MKALTALTACHLSIKEKEKQKQNINRGSNSDISSNNNVLFSAILSYLPLPHSTVLKRLLSSQTPIRHDLVQEQVYQAFIDGKRAKAQALYYNDFLAHLYPNNFPRLICHRVHVCFDVLITLEDCDRLFASLSRLKSGCSFQVIKSLCNGWTASWRMHEPVLMQCVFCSSVKDELRHYLQCRTFWHLLDNELLKQKSMVSLAPVRLHSMSPSSVLR